MFAEKQHLTRSVALLVLLMVLLFSTFIRYRLPDVPFQNQLKLLGLFVHTQKRMIRSR